MNRMEEFALLQQELDRPVPELEHTVAKALRRRRRNRMIAGPLTSIAAVFAVFVALVNFSTPVAMACSKVPVLRELAEFVRFSQSLSQAVENEYVQTMDLVQSNGTVTAKVEYLIVDQKRLNVYYSLSAPEYPEMSADLKLLLENGEQAPAVGVWGNQVQLPDGFLRDAEFTFDDTTMPDTLRLAMKVYGTTDPNDRREVLIGEFEFLLEFDPEYTAQGEILPVHQTVELNGQNFTIENLEIYPTHIRLILSEDPNNTLWLTDLDFYIQTRDGTQFHDGGGSVSASGAPNSESNLTYYADTAWFNSTKGMKLYITGAEWLKKNEERVKIDLVNETAEGLPEDVRLKFCKKEDDRWHIAFLTEREDATATRMRFTFEMRMYDGQENQYSPDEFYASTESDTVHTEGYWLSDYPDTEVWFVKTYSNSWQPEEPLKIKLS